MTLTERLSRAARMPGEWRRRHALAFGAMAGAVLGVVATLVATQLVAGEDTSLEPGELVIFSGRDDSAGGQRQSLIDQWNRTHPQNMATIKELPPIADAARTEMVADAQSGDEADIYNLDVTWTAEFAEGGYLRPLDESRIDRSEFLDNPISTCVYKDQLWALPFNTNAGLLYYRLRPVPDQTEPQRPPGSWEDLTRIADEALSEPGHDERLKAGLTTQLRTYEGLTVNALEAIQGVTHGTDFVRNDEINVSIDDIKAGIDRLRPSGSAGGGIVLPGSLDYDEQQSMQAFREGKTMFMRNWPVAYRDLYNQPDEPNDTPTPAVDFDVAPLPGNSILGGENLAIAATTDKPRAAQALIEYLTSPRSQQILFERGGYAATREIVYHDGAVRREYPYTNTLLQAILKARPRPVTPCYPQFTEAVQTAVTKALVEDEPIPDDFIDTLETALLC